MNLPVVPAKPADKPWYENGLNFTCTTCGNCCTGGPGFVFVEDNEIELAAKHLGIGVAEFRDRYCRQVGTRVSFKEVRQPSGLHDCIFLTEVAPKGSAGTSAAETKPASGKKSAKKELEPGQAVPLNRRVCAIYPVRPLQCRTWPFWPENMKSRAAWDRAAKGCPGMNRGGRHFTKDQAETIRDANEWPKNPPTSA